MRGILPRSGVIPHEWRYQALPSHIRLPCSSVWSVTHIEHLVKISASPPHDQLLALVSSLSFELPVCLATVDV